MKSKERIALRVLLFIARMMMGWSMTEEYKEMFSKINADIEDSKTEK